MDVLELPRPVINFLRTMAKEGCRYVLSWDIFGGNDAITLTLTWKSNENDDDNNDQSQLMKTPSEQVHDDLHIARNNSNSSSRRSRRDETAAIFRSSRGKSLENPHPHSHQISPKPMISHPSFISSLERSSIITRDKNESDPIYANLTHIKPSNNSQRTNETSILRKNPPTSSIVNETYSKLKRINIVTRKEHVDADVDDDDDETSDPWIKRLDPSLDKNTHAIPGKSDDEIDKSINPSSKVKFKRKPDYF